MGERGHGWWWLLLALVLLAAGLVWWLQGRGSAPEGPSTAVKRPAEDAAPREAPALRATGTTPETVAAEPPRGNGQIRGFVLDPAGAAVAGVPVVLRTRALPGRGAAFERGRAPGQMEREVARVLSDERGAFRFEGLATGGGPSPGSQRSSWIVRAEVSPPRSSTQVNLSNWGPVRSQTVVLEISEGTSVRAQIVDAAGQPLQATVRVTGDASDRRPWSYATWGFGPVTTDGEGYVTLHGAPKGRLGFDIFVGKHLAVRGMGVDVPEQGDVTVRVGALPAARVSGRVRDAQGEPVAGAEIMHELAASGDRPARYFLFATSGVDGSYVLDHVPPGLLERVSARATGLLPRTWRDVDRPVVAGEATELDLTLLAGGALAGRVVDEHGEPIEGARVVAHRSRPYLRGEGISDAEGNYRVVGLVPDTYDLYVQAPGYYDPQGPQVRDWGGGLGIRWRGGPRGRVHYSVVVPADGSEARRDFRMLRSMPLSGVVLNEDGTPAVGARVHFERQEPPQRGRRAVDDSTHAVHVRRLRPIATTDGEGRFEHPGPAEPSGTWIVGASSHGQCSEALRIRAFDTPPRVTLRLQKLGAIRGRVVTPEGEGLPWLTVRLDLEGGGTAALGLSDADGHFEFAQLTAGSYTAHVMLRVKRQWQTRGSSSTVVLTPGAVADRIQIRAMLPPPEATASGRRAPVPEPERRTITGTVLAPDGSLVDAGYVNITVDPRRSVSAAIVGGRFSKRIKAEVETIDFEVRDARDRSGRRIDHAPFALDGRPAGAGPFTLKLEAGAELAGHVEDDEGIGIPGVHVSVGEPRRFGRWGPEGKSAVTDAMGAFLIRGLAPGGHRLKLELSAEFLGPRSLGVTTDDKDLRVRFKRGAVIAGVVLGPDGKGLAGVELAAMPADGTRGAWVNGVSGPDGRFRFLGVAQDKVYTVRARPWERHIGRSDLMAAYVRDVRPGREDLELRLTVGTFIEGVLLGIDGEPAAGHRVAGFSQDEGGSGSSKTDAQGTFRLGPFRAGAAVNVVGYPQSKTADPVSLPEVTAPARGLTLRLTSSRVRRGRVTGDRLQSFQWAWTGAGSAHGARGPVDANGSFVLNRLPVEGTVTVVFYGREDDRYALLENVATAGEPLEVELHKGLRISGSIDPAVVGKDAKLVTIRAESIKHGFFRQAYMKAGRAFTLRGLPPGKYVLRVYSMGSKVLASAEFEAGAEDVLLR